MDHWVAVPETGVDAGELPTSLVALTTIEYVPAVNPVMSHVNTDGLLVVQDFEESVDT